MKMRTQLLLAQLPIGIIILTLAAFFLFFLRATQEKAEIILDDNLQSIFAMQNIQKSLDELNKLYTLQPQIAIEDPSKMQALENLIEEQLLIQEKNTNGAVEKELTTSLQNKWQDYVKAIHTKAFSLQSEEGGLYNDIKKLTSDIADWNEDQLIHIKSNLTTFISSVLFYITLGVILSLTFGFYLSWFLTGLFLSPLNKLGEIIRQMGLEDKTTLLHIKGSEEIESLCEEFNAMTRRLEEYHQGSLGKLRQTHQTFKVGFDSLPCPVLLLDPMTNFIYVNKLAQNLSKEFKKVPSLFHLEESWKEALIKISNQVVESKSPFTPKKEKDKITIIKDNKKLFFLPWAYPLLKGADKHHKRVEGVLLVLQNIVKGDMLESDQAEAYETLAHEIQPPLMDLHMVIHLCLQKEVGPLTEKQEEILQSAREKCDLLEKLSHDLLNLSKTSRKKKVPYVKEVDLNELVLKLIGTFSLESEEKGIKIIYEEPPYLSPIQADPEQLNKLTSSLLRNAIHYADPKTTVTLRLQEKEEQIILEIHNKGLVIPQKYREDIFKKHFKVPGQSEERAGLGLYIAKNIVTSLKGKIGVRSTSSQGTTFWATFPSVLGK